MSEIILVNMIYAPVQLCFDLARNIDVHRHSMSQYGERPVAGIQRGLIGKNETVTWIAKHFGFEFHLTSRITKFKLPFHFCDEMVAGPFKSMKHDHYFEEIGEITIMTDVFSFRSPLGFIGKWLDTLYFRRYLERLLQQRNRFIKRTAETNKWIQYL